MDDYKPGLQMDSIDFFRVLRHKICHVLNDDFIESMQIVENTTSNNDK